MDESLREQIQRTLSEHRVVLFMKGSRHFPQCGFSAQVVGILKQAEVEFHDVNILTEPELRQGLKEYSNWPTFPQLYVDGQLIGGCDIVTELHERGELETTLKKTR
jgi:monothiol glutaredoxin